MFSTQSVFPQENVFYIFKFFNFLDVVFIWDTGCSIAEHPSQPNNGQQWLLDRGYSLQQSLESLSLRTKRINNNNFHGKDVIVLVTIRRLFLLIPAIEGPGAISQSARKFPS